MPNLILKIIKKINTNNSIYAIISGAVLIFITYTSLELYVMKLLASIISEKYFLLNIYEFGLIYSFYIVIYLVQQHLIYNIPKSLGILINERIFSFLLNSEAINRETSHGEVYSLIIDEVKRLVHYVLTPMMQIIQRICTIAIYIGVGIYFFGTNILISGLVIIPIIFILKFQKRNRINYDFLINKSQSIRSELIQTIINDNLHIKSYRPASQITTLFNEQTKVFYDTFAKASILVDSQRIILDIAILSLILFIYSYGLEAPSAEKLILILIVFRGGPQIIGLLNSVTQLLSNISCATPISSMLEKDFFSRPILENFRNIEEINVELKNKIKFTIKQGINLVVGPSGSGKSTLLEDFFRKNPHILSSITSSSQIIPCYISAKPKIIPGDLHLNRIDDSVEKNDFIDYLNIFFKFQINIEVFFKNADRPSLGQLQRVAIARALASKCNLILIDETLSGMDSDTLNLILEKIEQSKKMILIATHDLRIINKYSPVYTFE